MGRRYRLVERIIGLVGWVFGWLEITHVAMQACCFHALGVLSS